MSNSPDRDMSATEGTSNANVREEESVGGDGTLVAVAESPGTEILVTDGLYRRAAEGVGILRAQLAAGAYKVVFTTADVRSEHIVVVRPGKETKLAADRDSMRFPTAAPLRGTSNSREYHRQAALELSLQKPVRIGRGGKSRLFLFVRRLERSDQRLTEGLTLWNDRDKPAFDLATLEEEPRDEAWAGIHLELEPGNYRLRMAAGPEYSVEQTVVTCSGWQTQVLLLRRPWSESNATEQWFDLSQASILMARPEVGFKPEKQERLTTSRGEWENFDLGLRWTEQARRALADGRVAVADHLLDDFLYQKLDNPMLGIFGAHLLLRRLDDAPQPKHSRNEITSIRRRLFDIAVRLRGVVGNHPDVLALLTKCSPRQADVAGLRFPHPPMLRSSWDAVIAASADYKELIPARTLAARISARTTGACGTWLSWQPVQGAPQLPPAGWSKGTGGLGIGKIRELYRKVVIWVGAHASRCDELAGADPRLRSDEQILHYFLDVAKYENRKRFKNADEDLVAADPESAAGTREAASEIERGKGATAAASKGAAVRGLANPYLRWPSIVRMLQLPPATIERSLHSIESKMEDIAPKSPESWPPPDSLGYLHGESFGRLMLDLARQLMGKYRSMDFTDAVGQVYAWLEGKVAEEPDFVTSGKFKSQRAFLGYVKQAMWNAGRLAARKRKRHETLGLLPIEEPVDKRDASAEAAVEFVEQIDQLPELERKVLYHYLLKEKSLDEVARIIGRSLKATVALYERAIMSWSRTQQATTGGPTKRPKPAGKKPRGPKPGTAKSTGLKKGLQSGGRKIGAPRKTPLSVRMSKKGRPKKS